MKKKILLVVSVVLCAALLVAGSLAGTFAYLTAKITITNTFTVGNVKIDLTESLVDLDGTPIAGAQRVHQNEYHLVPGSTYTKDPMISIAANSEANYLFVNVKNGLSSLAMSVEEAEDRDLKTVAQQLAANGWVPLSGLTGTGGVAPSNAADIYVYTFKETVDSATVKYIVPKSAEVTTIKVFDTFTVSNYVTDVQLADCEGATIEITAYAVQGEGFESPVDAWNKTFGAPAETTPVQS